MTLEQTEGPCYSRGEVFNRALNLIQDVEANKERKKKVKELIERLKSEKKTK
ncbi:MAG: hypothetical protein WC872_03995 [Candidatus Absconditabacterales bacterium]